jgi:hypothetical protein
LQVYALLIRSAAMINRPLFFEPDYVLSPSESEQDL